MPEKLLLLLAVEHIGIKKRLNLRSKNLNLYKFLSKTIFVLVSGIYLLGP